MAASPALPFPEAGRRNAGEGQEHSVTPSVPQHRRGMKRLLAVAAADTVRWLLGEMPVHEGVTRAPGRTGGRHVFGLLGRA
uniref:Uncharacterized protein n=1 Tax=Oryza rufipogon TaxID=4529 RepID=A0A0E0NJH7_ORYRU